MITIIIPSYNEEKNIVNTVKQLKNLEIKEEYEIMVVDDGSSDRTAEKAQKAEADKVVSYEPNRGKGYAMRKGVNEANGEKILFTDADQHHISKIPEFIEKLEKNTVVTGKRNFNKLPWPRRINNSLAKLVMLLATGKIVKDPICGIRAMYKKDFQTLNLKENGFETESEINLKAIKSHMKMKYVPVEIEYPLQTFKFNELGLGKSIKLASYLIKSMVKSWLGKYKTPKTKTNTDDIQSTK